MSSKSMFSEDPEELIPSGLSAAQIMQESGGRHRDASGRLITSKAGAFGIAQLMPGTARQPGFGISPAADDSEEENLRVGNEYMDAMRKAFHGDEAKAHAAYNAGPARVQKAIAKYGDDWLSHLPKETKDYVSKLAKSASEPEKTTSMFSEDPIGYMKELETAPEAEEVSMFAEDPPGMESESMFAKDPERTGPVGLSRAADSGLAQGGAALNRVLAAIPQLIAANPAMFPGNSAQGIADKVSDIFRKSAESWDETASMTPEEQANMTLLEQGVQMGAGMAPAFAAGGAFGVGGAGVALGLQSIGETFREAEEGMSLGALMLKGPADAMINVASMAIPLLSKSVPAAVLEGAVSNAASGWFADIVNSNILKATGDLPWLEKYNPWDLKKRAFEAVFGGALSGVGKLADRRSGKWTEEEVDTIFQEGIAEVARRTGKINANLKDFDFSPYMHEPDPALRWSKVISDVMDDQFVDGANGPIAGANEDKLRVVFDYISKNSDSPKERAMATHMYSLFDFHKGISERLTESTTDAGWYDPGLNIMGLHKSDSTPETFLHEAHHQITGLTINWYKQVKEGRATLQNLTEERMFDTMKGLDEIYTDFRVDLLKKGVPHESKWIQEQLDSGRSYERMWQDLWDNRGITQDEAFAIYGLKNLHEFTAELTLRKEFRDNLERIDMSPTKAHPYMVDISKNPSTKDTFLSGVRLDNSQDKTVRDLALYHYSNIYDALSGAKHHDINNISHIQQELQDLMGKDVSIEQLASARHRANEPKFDVADYIMMRIGQLMNRVDSAVELKVRIDNLFPQAEWKQFVHDNIGRMIRNRARYEKIFTDFHHDISTGKGKMTQDPRNIDKIFDGMFKDKGASASDDASPYGKFVFGSDALSELKQGTKGDLLIRALNDKINEHRASKMRYYHDFLEGQKSFMALKNPGRINVMKVASFWDSPNMRAFLESKKLWWPTDDMLRRSGLNDAEMKAYKDMAAGYDRMYDTLDAAGATLWKTLGADIKAEIAPDGSMVEWKLNRIPGFMPHFHQGAIKVMLKVKDANGRGPDKMIVRGFDQIWQAKRYIKRIHRDQANRSGNTPIIEILPGDAGLQYRVQKDRSPALGITPTLIEHYVSYRNFSSLAPEIANHIAKLDLDDARGYHKSLMERQNVEGYINDAKTYGKMNTLLGIPFLPNQAAVDAFGIYQKYARSVADFAGNAFFVRDVYAPLIGSKSKDYPEGRLAPGGSMPNVHDYVTAQAKNFTGENINHLKWLDQVFETIGTKAQLNPHAIKFFVRNVRGLLSTVKLRNVRNWFSNYVQPANGIGMLYHFAVHYNLSPLAEAARYNPWESLSWAYKELGHGLSKDGRFALEWAKANHIVDPQQEAEVGRGKLINYYAKALDYIALGKFGEHIEGFGRTATFLSAYKYMQQFYSSKIEALQAADRATRTIMVNYDRSARPHMFQNFGVLGELLSPFAVYRNQYIGNTLMMFKDIFKNPTRFENYRPFLAGQMIYFIQAGFAGLILASEVDWLLSMWNDVAPDDMKFPTLREMAVKYDLPDWFAFGLTSEMTKQIPITPDGFYIGSSGMAPNATNLDSPPLAPFLSALAAFGIIPIKEVWSLMFDTPGASSDEMYAAVRQIIPPNLIPYLDEYMTNSPDIGPKATSLEAVVERTESDSTAMKVTGATGLTEYRARIVEQTLLKKQQTMNNTVKKFVDKAVDWKMDLPLGMDPNEAFDRAKAANPILTKEEFYDSMTQELISRRMGKERRSKLGTDSPEAAYQRQLRRDYGQ